MGFDLFDQSHKQGRDKEYKYRVKEEVNEES
jgi:hypothetical protein